MKRILRILIPALAMLLVAASPAGADSWATGRWSNSPPDYGSYGVLNFSCLYSPNPTTNFADDEMWQGTDSSGSGGYWVEQGGSYGAPVGASRYWFWADNTPSFGYQEHDSAAGSASLNTNYDVEFDYNGSNEWLVWHQGSILGTSTSNPPNGNYLQAGGEHTDVANGRTVGSVSSLAWYDTSFSGHSGWTDTGYSNPTGQTSGGSYSWNANYTTVSWNSNNC
jgi:hypothetical protein